jgi:hypothetical protein
LGLKEAANQMASVNGSSRRTEFGCSQKRAASEVEIGLLSNDPNAGANSFVRGAHHRRCAREGLTCIMMPYIGVQLQGCGPSIEYAGLPSPVEYLAFSQKRSA